MCWRFLLPQESKGANLENVEGGFTKLTGWLDSNNSSGFGTYGTPFKMGNTLRFAYVMIVSNLMWVKVVLGED